MLVPELFVTAPDLGFVGYGPYHMAYNYKNVSDEKSMYFGSYALPENLKLCIS